ncbi:unnamed protein product [Calypogeia fissa]
MAEIVALASEVRASEEIREPESVGWTSARTDDLTWRLHASRFPRQRMSEKSPESLKASMQKCLKVFGLDNGVAKYYRHQDEMLDTYKEMDDITEHGYRPTTTADERAKIEQGEVRAIRISNVVNMILFAAKVFASVKSGSLAIIASTLDSFMDLLSGFILWFTSHSMRRPNPYLYPIGKNRMQPIGILVFASVMATLGLLIIYESARRLISLDRSFDLRGSKRFWVIGIMSGASVVKLFLMMYCRMFDNEIVRTYALDHFFDVITNVIGLLAAVLASLFGWWIDPVGAIVLALYTIRTWSMAVKENVNSLVSKTARPDYLKKLTYLCWNHHKDIRQIDTVRAYSFGENYFAEVDIVLPGEMPLQEAHDIGESLQNKLESLPDIERAFVHLDYEVSHRPEHAGHSYK